jgi:hypothetical protein
MAATMKRVKWRGTTDPVAGPFVYSFFKPMGNGVWNFYWPYSDTQNNADIDYNNVTWEVWQQRTGCTAGTSWSPARGMPVP